MRAIEWLIFFLLGIVVGTAWSAHNYLPREKRLKAKLVVARTSAASCYGIVGDHWMDAHPDNPGSMVISATAHDLALNFQYLLDHPKWDSDPQPESGAAR